MNGTYVLLSRTGKIQLVFNIFGNESMTFKWGCRSGGESVRLLGCLQKLVADDFGRASLWKLLEFRIYIRN